MDVMTTAADFSFTEIMSDITTFIGNLFTIIQGNWLLIFLLLAPFVIGLLIALVHSLRG